MSRIRTASFLLLLCMAICLSFVSASGECGHIHTAEQVLEAPTCTKYGTIGLICTDCGEQIKDYVIPLDPLGHDFRSVTLCQPTCTQSGEAYEECARCGLRGGTISLAATGHSPDSPVQENVVHGSCTQEGGYDQVVCCSTCGTLLRRDHVFTAGGEGHSLGFPEVITEPTCQHGGIEVRNCLNCGYSESWTLPAADHVRKYRNENQVRATCEEHGTYDYVTYCEVCGQVLDRLACSWKALGHKWGGLTLEKKPTTYEDGLMYRVCIRDASHVDKIVLPGYFRDDTLTQDETAPLEFGHTLSSPLNANQSGVFFPYRVPYASTDIDIHAFRDDQKQIEDMIRKLERREQEMDESLEKIKSSLADRNADFEALMDFIHEKLSLIESLMREAEKREKVIASAD